MARTFLFAPHQRERHDFQLCYELAKIVAFSTEVRLQKNAPASESRFFHGCSVGTSGTRTLPGLSALQDCGRLPRFAFHPSICETDH